MINVTFSFSSIAILLQPPPFLALATCGQLAETNHISTSNTSTSNHISNNQGQTGRVFQLRVGSGSGIEKIFRVRSGRVGYRVFVSNTKSIGYYGVLKSWSGIRRVSPLFPILFNIIYYIILSYLINMVNQTCVWSTYLCHSGPVHYEKVEKWAKKCATLKTFFSMDVDAKGTKF